MRLFSTVLLSVVLVVVSAGAAFAQPAPPPPLNEVPFDALAILLMVAGAGYGASRMLKKDD